MREEKKGLSREDYEEPRCLTAAEDPGRRSVTQAIPQRRVMEKLDEYMRRRDYAGAEKHLLYWLEEARQGRDRRGELLVLGELVGHYRKSGKETEALACAGAALELVEALDMGDRPSGATTFVNVATAYSAFGRDEEALPLFERARAIYEAAPRPDPGLLGGLYNNMALVLADLGRFAEARGLYEKALVIMEPQPNGALELAITELNLANLAEAEQGLLEAETEIEARLDRARALLDRPELPRNGYYAFVCEKCAPTFDYYGRFTDAAELREIARKLYAGN